MTSLSVTSANYTEAVSILTKRFGGRQQIVNKHIEALLNMEPVQSCNIKLLRHLLDQVESHVRSLKSLDVQPDSYSSVLTSVLLNKLPPDIRLIVSRQVSVSDWNLDSLMTALDEEIGARERAATLQVTSPHSIVKKTPPTARAMLTTNTCAYCGQGHTASSCPTVTDTDKT